MTLPAASPVEKGPAQTLSDSFPFRDPVLANALLITHLVAVTREDRLRSNSKHCFPANSARFGYATEGALFISAQLSTDAVSERFGH